MWGWVSSLWESEKLAGYNLKRLTDECNGILQIVSANKKTISSDDLSSGDVQTWQKILSAIEERFKPIVERPILFNPLLAKTVQQLHLKVPEYGWLAKSAAGCGLLVYASKTDIEAERLINETNKLDSLDDAALEKLLTPIHSLLEQMKDPLADDVFNPEWMEACNRIIDAVEGLFEDITTSNLLLDKTLSETLLVLRSHPDLTQYFQGLTGSNILARTYQQQIGSDASFICSSLGGIEPADDSVTGEGGSQPVTPGQSPARIKEIPVFIAAPVSSSDGTGNAEVPTAGPTGGNTVYKTPAAAAPRLPVTERGLTPSQRKIDEYRASRTGSGPARGRSVRIQPSSQQSAAGVPTSRSWGRVHTTATERSSPIKDANLAIVSAIIQQQPASGVGQPAVVAGSSPLRYTGDGGSGIRSDTVGTGGTPKQQEKTPTQSVTQPLSGGGNGQLAVVVALASPPLPYTVDGGGNRSNTTGTDGTPKQQGKTLTQPLAVPTETTPIRPVAVSPLPGNPDDRRRPIGPSSQDDVNDVCCNIL